MLILYDVGLVLLCTRPSPFFFFVCIMFFFNNKTCDEGEGLGARLVIDNSWFVHFYYYFECSVGKYTMNATKK